MNDTIVTPPRRAKARKLILSDEDSDDEFVGFEAKKPTKKVPEKTQKTKPTTKKENQPKTVDLASGGETKILERVATKYKSDTNDLENEHPQEENITEIEKFINETNKNPSSTRDLKDFSSICDADFAPKTSMAGLPSIVPSMPLKENKAKVIPNYIRKAMEKRGIDIEKTNKTPESIKESSIKGTKTDKDVKNENKAGNGDSKEKPSTSRPSRQRRKLIVSDDSNSENSSDEDDDFGKKSPKKTVPQSKKTFVTPLQSKKPTDTPALTKKQAAILHLAHITPKPAQQQSKNPEKPKVPDAAASPILGVAKPKLISMPKWTPPARVGQKSRDSISPSGLSNLSPGFRVGLSRNGKFKPLHPNVKMAP